VEKLVGLTQIPCDDFSNSDQKDIKYQFETFIIHVRRLNEFRVCHDLAILAAKMVELEIEGHVVFPLVYHLIEFALLLLPVVTTSVERAFQQ